jgi:hypothetical protein
MPVDTGFLRASFRASYNGLPKGLAAPARRGRKKRWSAESTVITRIAGLQPDQTIFLGWTAAYARFMEARYSFREGGVEQWQEIVERNARRARAEIK